MENKRYECFSMMEDKRFLIEIMSAKYYYWGIHEIVYVVQVFAKNDKQVHSTTSTKHQIPMPMTKIAKKKSQ